MSVPHVSVQKPALVVLSLQETLWPQLEATASNLANSTTTGFKRLVSENKEYPYTIPGKGAISYAAFNGAHRDMTQGPLKPTDNRFDVAVSGTGFFMTEGNRLTRNGQFSVTTEGSLSNALGEPIFNTSGSPITIPPGTTDIIIDKNGIISKSNGTVIDQLGVFQMPEGGNLTYLGDGYYKASVDPIPADLNQYEVFQGFIEDSNVSATEETISMMDVLRLFQEAQKMIDEEIKRKTQVINVSSRNS